MLGWIVMAMLVAAGIAALARIIVNVRKIRAAPVDDWDAKIIERLRSAGADPFQPHEADFFFALPTEEACRAVRAVLESEGYVVDVKAAPEMPNLPFSLHARKAMRLSVPDMQDLSRRFRELAQASGGHYDGWS
jgi:hypothetical protein